MARPKKTQTVHGCSDTPLYNVYNQMRYRCKPGNKHPQAKDYADRGIRVCQVWLDDFLAFQAWALANGYQKDLCIDRIDVDGNYEPDNCRWVNRKTQQRNRRHNFKIEHNGQQVVVLDLMDAYGVTERMERDRVWERMRHRNMTLEQARVDPGRPVYHYEGQTYRMLPLYEKLRAKNRMAVCFSTFYNRILKGWDIDRAKDMPPQTRNGRIHR